MPHEDVTIAMREGDCPAHVFTAARGDRRGDPAILFYMDAGGIRPAALDMRSGSRTPATSFSCPTSSTATVPTARLCPRRFSQAISALS